MSEECSIEGCDKPVKCRSLCQVHYDKKRRGGETLPERKVSIDAEDAIRKRTINVNGCMVWTGHLNVKGYGHININGSVVRVHRYVWEKANGPIPKGMVIDHKCHNRACLNLEHLRLATGYENQSNRSGANRNSTTGLRNVCLIKGKFQVRVHYQGKTHRGGVFDDLNDAAVAAELLRKKLFGDFRGLS